MNEELSFLKVMRSTKILRPPKHALATFGSTTLHYVLLSQIPQAANQCRRREGRVTAERPKILTPDLGRKRFAGFGEETEIYKGLMDQMFGEAFRGLEYLFKNELDSTSLETSPLPEVAERTLHTMESENAPRTALLQGPDAAWGFSIMQFIVEVSLRSFPANVKELDERGLFEPEKRAETRQRQQIEQLFREAPHHPPSLKTLAATLNASGLFAEYEDRFFALVKNS